MLEPHQDASDRAREDNVVGRMARETGRTSKFPSSTSSLVDERMSELTFWYRLRYRSSIT
jgi:hypothetical protein